MVLGADLRPVAPRPVDEALVVAVAHPALAPAALPLLLEAGQSARRHVPSMLVFAILLALTDFKIVV